MTPSSQRVLVTVTGPDTPGITAALTSVIADNGASLIDIEQVVVQRQLILAMLVSLDATRARGEPVLKDLLFTAKNMGLDLQFQALEAEGDPKNGGGERWAVTAIGDTIDAAGMYTLSRVLASHGANIETIRQLSDGRLTSVEIIVYFAGDGGRAMALRRDLMEATAEQGIDVALQRETLTRRSKRLVIMDMDSTLIRIEVIDELARLHGVLDQVAGITARAMAGDLDYEQSLRERVALLAGMEYPKVLALAADLPITEGAGELLGVLRTLGYKTGVISGGFTFAANALKEILGLDYAYANRLEVEGGRLTGRVLDPVVTPQRKADLLDAIAQGEGISLEQTIAIGDGANDLAMLERAGLGIAFHAKPKLRAAADTAVSAGGLDRILYLLGLHARDVRELCPGTWPRSGAGAG
jgi:phosphoserine phosphatase